MGREQLSCDSSCVTFLSLLLLATECGLLLNATYRCVPGAASSQQGRVWRCGRELAGTHRAVHSAACKIAVTRTSCDESH